MIANAAAMAVLGGFVGLFVAIAADCLKDRSGDRPTNLFLGMLFMALALACCFGAAIAGEHLMEAFVRSVR